MNGSGRDLIDDELIVNVAIRSTRSTSIDRTVVSWILFHLVLSPAVYTCVYLQYTLVYTRVNLDTWSAAA